jgi:hypothetical protein
MYDTVGKGNDNLLSLKKFKEFIPLKERYSIIGNILSALDNNVYDLNYIAEKVYPSPAISANFIRYLRLNNVYNLTNVSNEKKEDFDIILSGLMTHGIVPLIEVLINTRRTKIPPEKTDHFFLLPNNVHKFEKEFFSQKSNSESSISPKDQKNSSLYSQFYGIEALIYLERDYKDREKSEHYRMDLHTFDKKIHANARQFGEAFNFPTFLRERSEESRKIPGVSFSYATITEAMNCLLGLNEISFLSPEHLILSEEMLKEKSDYLKQKLENLVQYNSELESIWDFEIDTTVYTGENQK